MPCFQDNSDLCLRCPQYILVPPVTHTSSEARRCAVHVLPRMTQHYLLDYVEERSGREERLRGIVAVTNRHFRVLRILEASRTRGQWKRSDVVTHILGTDGINSYDAPICLSSYSHCGARTAMAVSPTMQHALEVAECTSADASPTRSLRKVHVVI